MYSRSNTLFYQNRNLDQKGSYQSLCNKVKKFHSSDFIYQKAKVHFFLQKLINYGDQRGTHTARPRTTSPKELVLVPENGDTMLCCGSFGRNQYLEFNLQRHGGIKWKGHDHFGKIVFKTQKQLPIYADCCGTSIF